MKKFSRFIVTLMVVFGLGTPVFFVGAVEQQSPFAEQLMNTAVKTNLILEGTQQNKGTSAENITLENIIGQYIQIALSFVGIVFFILIFYAGILWMISLDVPQRMVDARRTIIHATVGLLITLSAYALVGQVLDIINKTLTQ